MKPLVIIFSLSILFSCDPISQKSESSIKVLKQIDSLLVKNDFFKVKDLLEENAQQLTDYDRFRLEASVYNAFNKLEESNQAITTLFKGYDQDLSDSLKADLLDIQSQNHFKLHSYEEAYKVSEERLKKYAKHYNEDELTSIKNVSKIWKALVGQDKQVVTIPSSQVIRLQKDKAGLSNLPVKANNDSTGFIFDTGANISTVTQSVAQQMNMKLLDASFEVNSISGIKVKSGLAVAPSFTIKDILVENAVFLVFPDSALAFQQIDYQINGIIGYPVMAAMKEIQLTKSDQMIIPAKSSAYERQNMAMMFLTPLIELVSQYDTLVFTFDTGADATTLYKDYFIKNKEFIETNYSLTKTSLGGAGGKNEVDGYYVPLPLTVGEDELVIDSVQLLTENLMANRENIYGNIGQDLISKYDTLVINFEEMFIDFR